MLQISFKIGKVRTSIGVPKIIDKSYVVNTALYPGTELTLIPGTRDYLQILLDDQVIYNISEDTANVDALVDDVQIVKPGVIKILRNRPISVKFRIPNKSYVWVPMYPFVIAAYLIVFLLVICNVPERLLGDITST